MCKFICKWSWVVSLSGVFQSPSISLAHNWTTPPPSLTWTSPGLPSEPWDGTYCNVPSTIHFKWVTHWWATRGQLNNIMMLLFFRPTSHWCLLTRRGDNSGPSDVELESNRSLPWTQEWRYCRDQPTFSHPGGTSLPHASSLEKETGQGEEHTQDYPYSGWYQAGSANSRGAQETGYWLVI